MAGLYSLTSIATVVGDLVFENSFAYLYFYTTQQHSAKCSNYYNFLILYRYFISPKAFVYIPGVQFLESSILFLIILFIASIVFVVYPEGVITTFNINSVDSDYPQSSIESPVSEERARLIND